MRPVIILFACASLGLAQSGGRFEEQKRHAFAAIQNGNFDKAAAQLEEVWDLDKSDPAVAEYLAIAYLNGVERRYTPAQAQKAYELMRAAVSAGGRATFLVNHSHERFTFIQGSRLTKYCAGRLSISQGRLVFVSEGGERTSEHSFDIGPEDLKEIASSNDRNRGMFHLKGRAGTRDFNYNMVPQSWAEQDTQVLVAFVKEYVRK